MSTKSEPLDLYFEGQKACTRFRLKKNTSSVYVNLESLQIPYLSVKIVGRNDNSNNFINYTYKTDSFPIQAGRKYFLYNLSPANQEVRLEFEGPNVGSLKGVWSPDSVSEPGCITIGPEYKTAKANTSDSPFSFTSSFDGQEFYTDFREKKTNSSVYINIIESSFKGVAEVRILGNNGPDTNEENCTYKRDHFNLEAGKKYEAYNYVNEHGYSHAALVFKLKAGCTIRGKWSPDYVRESGVIALGGNNAANTSDTGFDFNSSSFRTEPRVKTNSTSVYMKIIEMSAPFTVKIMGISDNENISNQTNNADSYTIDHPGKYELYNTVHENQNDSAMLEFQGINGTVHVKGVWSPDMAPDPACAVLGCSLSRGGVKIAPISNPIKKIDVPYISQQGIPTGCESVSATMVLRYNGIDIRPYDFITRYLPMMPFSSGPDPNVFFVGCPMSSHAFGCYSKCITNAMKEVVKGKDFDVKNTTGNTLQALIDRYINAGIPVVVWATMGMLPTRVGSSAWTIKTVTKESTCHVGDRYQWLGNEHCLVLVGYTANGVIVNDPLAGVGVYDRGLFESRFNEQGKHSVVMVPKSSVKYGPEQMKFPPIPPSKPAERSIGERVVQGLKGCVGVIGGTASVAAAVAAIGATEGAAAIPAFAYAGIGIADITEGVNDIINAFNDNPERGFNPIRDTLFDGNDTAYSVVSLLLSCGVSALPKRSLEKIGATAFKFKGQGPINAAKGEWGVVKNGMEIDGVFYTEHALTRMAPNTAEGKNAVLRLFEEHNPSKGLVPGTEDYIKWQTAMKKFVQPRDVSPELVREVLSNIKPETNYKLVKGVKVLDPEKLRFTLKAFDNKHDLHILTSLDQKRVITVMLERLKNK